MTCWSLLGREGKAEWREEWKEERKEERKKERKNEKKTDKLKCSMHARHYQQTSRIPFIPVYLRFELFSLLLHHPFLYADGQEILWSR